MDEERINDSLVEKLKFGQDIKTDFVVTFYKLKFGSDMVTTTSRPTKASSWISKQVVGNPHIQVRFPTTC